MKYITTPEGRAFITSSGMASGVSNRVTGGAAVLCHY